MAETLVVHDCSEINGYTGTSTWHCQILNSSPQFSTSEPDRSECFPNWLNELQENPSFSDIITASQDNLDDQTTGGAIIQLIDTIIDSVAYKEEATDHLLLEYVQIFSKVIASEIGWLEIEEHRRFHTLTMYVQETIIIDSAYESDENVTSNTQNITNMWFDKITFNPEDMRMIEVKESNLRKTSLTLFFEPNLEDIPFLRQEVNNQSMSLEIFVLYEDYLSSFGSLTWSEVEIMSDNIVVQMSSPSGFKADIVLQTNSDNTTDFACGQIIEIKNIIEFKTDNCQTNKEHNEEGTIACSCNFTAANDFRENQGVYLISAGRLKFSEVIEEEEKNGKAEFMFTTLFLGFSTAMLLFIIIWLHLTDR